MHSIFSTAGLGARDSFGHWCEAVRATIAPVEMTRLSDRPFVGSLESGNVGALRVIRASSIAMRGELTAHAIRRMSGRPTLCVTMGLSGLVAFVQDGREAVQRRGDITILDRRPTVSRSSDDSQVLFLELPRERLESALGPARQYAALTIGADQASASLFTTFINRLVGVHDRLAPATAERMSSIGIDLLVSSIAQRLARDPPKSLHRSIVVQRAKAYIETNLSDPTLDPPGLANAMGVSLRRLQELFHESGRHISDWIWQRRLEVASMRLSDPGYDHLPIGTLAHGCGFASQAHFSRRFRDRYGMSPRAYREGATERVSPPEYHWRAGWHAQEST